VDGTTKEAEATYVAMTKDALVIKESTDGEGAGDVSVSHAEKVARWEDMLDELQRPIRSE
jgi:hypothetical protein